MGNFWAVYKRELRSYFMSPLAYVIYFLFLVLCAVFFNMYFKTFLSISQRAAMMQQMGPMQLPNYTEMVLLGITNVMTFILLFLIPLLSMRLFAEEKKMGTFELLMTYPLRDVEVLLGKYFAALTVLIGMVVLSFANIIMSKIVVPGQTYIPAVLASYVGILLVGMAFLALGIFASSLTDNQIVAGMIAFASLLVLWMIGFVDEISPDSLIGTICNEISVYAHFDEFSRGVITTGHVAYYILFTVFFLFFTLRILESNRWKG